MRETEREKGLLELYQKHVLLASAAARLYNGRRLFTRAQLVYKAIFPAAAGFRVCL